MKTVNSARSDRALGGLFRSIVLCLFLQLVVSNGTHAAPELDAPPASVNFTITVLDKNTQTPLELARVALLRGRTVVVTRSTNVAGVATFKDVAPGWYVVGVHLVGYHDVMDSMLIDEAHTADTVIIADVQRQEFVVTATREQQAPRVVSSVDLRSGAQTFDAETYHAPPAARMTNLIQQNVAGAVRASTGEVHVRGQHGEFTYYVDGIPIPLSVFGGLNEVVDPRVIHRATTYTGGFPAEYGGQMAAIMDIQTGVPAGRFHLDASSYVGSYLTSGDSLGDRVGALSALNSNGQSLSLSNQLGNLGFYLSGSRQETDRRIDQPTPTLFHDHGFDYFLYGKAHYVFSANDYMTFNGNYSITHTQIPYDPSEGIQHDDQHSYNSFQTLSYFHTFSSEVDNESNLFIGAYTREGGLGFTPSLFDEPKQFLQGDTTHGYVVAEDRSFTTVGLRAKYDVQLSHQLGFATGLSAAVTSGTEDFNFMSNEVQGPRSVTEYSGSDVGGFVQGSWHPLEWTKLDAGVRYDQHVAPDADVQRQLSPRVKLSFFPDEFSTVYFYYGRLFMPTNIEGLRSVASQLGESSQPTLPERDHFFEAVATRSWDFGLTGKAAAYYKKSTPGLDDETLGSSSIKVNVNIAEVHVTGVELALSYSDPTSPLSAYANASLIHAYGRGPVSGGFLASDSSTDAFDLDHDQRLSAVIGVNYQPHDWFVDLSAIYGSGLANGADDVEFATGLFDFNQAAHTTPSWIINASLGYTFALSGGMTLQPSIYVTNLLDHHHLIKGAFFSGASFEEARNVVVRVDVHL